MAIVIDRLIVAYARVQIYNAVGATYVRLILNETANIQISRRDRSDYEKPANCRLPSRQTGFFFSGKNSATNWGRRCSRRKTDAKRARFGGRDG